MTQSACLRGDLLILAQSILLPATCLITYTIATSLNHVETRFPYISDTGTWPPESCIFGILLVLFSICTLLVVYGRWRMVRNSDRGSLCRRINRNALVVGMTAALGVLIVATFQETSVLVVHLIGAILAFAFGNIYMWLHSFISRRITNIPGFISWVVTLRFIVSIMTTISVLLVPVFTFIAQARYDGNESFSHEIGTGKWTSDDGGYDMHVAATSLEWTLAFYTSIFFLTFVREFRHVYFGMPMVNLNSMQIANLETDGQEEEKRGGIDGPEQAISREEAG